MISPAMLDNRRSPHVEHAVESRGAQDGPKSLETKRMPPGNRLRETRSPRSARTAFPPREWTDVPFQTRPSVPPQKHPDLLPRLS